MHIKYGLHKHWLGTFLVGVTDEGLCLSAITTKQDVPQVLHTYYPYATYSHDQAASEPWFKHLSELVDGKVKKVKLPVDVDGTPFEQEVWDAIAQVPYGEVITYTDLANMINSPKAVRAVANACGSNPISIAVPCHRILRADGGLGGYAWGIEVKRKLLDTEQSHSGRSSRLNA